jgi:NADH:ubiquinone oxidoreductase subunit F (NADH-binding)
MTATLVASPGHLLPPRSAAGLADHLERYGPLPLVGTRRDELFEAVAASGLAGRGGAGFPTVRKLRAVAAGKRPIVVANGTEGEPASAKDKVLMANNPHLVIDGVLAAESLVGAEESVIAVGRADAASRRALRAALSERSDGRHVRIEAVPDRFVAGEESALVAWLNGRDAKPTLKPPRPSERGVRGRPTLVQNVETLANLALLARRGAEWFTEQETILVTVRGAVRRAGVVEVRPGTPIAEILERCGGAPEPLQAFLVGGYFGSWIAAEDNLDLPFEAEALAPLGASLGARTLIAFPTSACGVAETARVAAYLAGQSAGQCGPCVFGLPAVVQCMDVVARGGPASHAALERLPTLHAQIARRGACAHPDGTIALVESALRVFVDEIDLHLTGRCSGHTASLLPTTSTTDDWR